MLFISVYFSFVKHVRTNKTVNCSVSIHCGRTREKMNRRILETERLVLRPWREEDASDLYEYAKDPRIGPVAGWIPHTDVEHSLRIIREILFSDGTFAVVLKKEDIAIGSIGLSMGSKSSINLGDGEASVGYWIGVPFWGLGLITEAACEVIKYAFNDLSISTLWSGYFDGNERSKRVQEKCGFVYHRTEYNKKHPGREDVVTQHISCLTKEEWISLSEQI